MSRLPIALLIVCLSTPVFAEPEPRLAVSPAQQQALGIETLAIESTTRIARPRLPGRMALPNRNLRVLTARTPGVLLSLEVAVGDHVEAGQELARIESPAYVSLQREYLEAQSQLALARSTATRESQLAEEGIVAGRRAEASMTRLRESRARLEESRHTLALAGMNGTELDALTESRRSSPIAIRRAPVSGVVLEQHAHPGEQVEAGSALYRIGDLDTLSVEIHTPVDIARSQRPGMRFEIEGRDLVGVIDAIGRKVHAVDQGVLVRGTIDNVGQQLGPGEFVWVELENAPGEAPAFDLPSRAVVHLEARPWIFRQTPDGFEPVPVVVVGGSGQRSVISGSIRDGDRVATRGTAALKSLWLSARVPD